VRLRFYFLNVAVFEEPMLCEPLLIRSAFSVMKSFFPVPLFEFYDLFSVLPGASQIALFAPGTFPSFFHVLFFALPLWPFAHRLSPVLGKPEITVLTGFTSNAKQGAQGAALLADGLAGGWASDLVRAMQIREATGTVLDHLYVISPADARRRLGLT